MSAPITGQTITFEQISETLRTQYSDAEKRLQDSSKTQVDPMRLNKNPKSLDNDIRARLENKPMLAPPEMQVLDSDNATTAKTNDARLTMILGNLTGIADQDITTRLHNNLDSTLLRHEMAHNKFRELSDAYSSSLDSAQKPTTSCIRPIIITMRSIKRCNRWRKSQCIESRAVATATWRSAI